MLALVTVAPAAPVVSAAPPAVSVTIDDSEARATLAILSKLRGNTPVTPADWNTLFATPGYQRLKAREAQFKRPFTDDDFKVFVSSPKLIAQLPELSSALQSWMSANVTAIAQRSFAYLPAAATIHATVYPLIKPRPNSFVYQLDTDPAVMLYLNPSVTKQQFANTVSHELFHVGDAQNCPAAPVIGDRQKAFLEWLSAFGEGSAVLAAAGGPDVHPHWADPQSDRDVWDKAMAGFQGDFQTLAQFFSDIATGRLTGDAIATKGYTFFGAVQGPWYTVGYKIDVTIERMLGRKKLVEALCDKREYLSTYNTAATMSNRTGNARLPLWPSALAGFFKTPLSPAKVMILGVAHLVAKRDVHNSVFQDSPLSAKRQVQIEDVVTRLARFHPTKVLVEADMTNPVYADRYRRYLAGTFALPANEVYQFGFRLAKRAGNATIYPVDTDGPQLYTDKSPEARVMAPFLDKNFTRVSDPLFDAFLARSDALERNGTYLELFRYLNTDAAIRANASWYSILVGMGREADNAGAGYVAQWYVRNTYIFSNILGVIQPGDRVVVMMGQGHEYLLREFVRLNPNLVNIDPLSYLK